MHRAHVATAYDSRADAYIERLGAVEQMAVQDRKTIASWRDGFSGRILDAGSGPGHWSDLLCAGGRRHVVGIDASARFTASAHRRFADVDFLVGDLTALPLARDSVDGILAWFSIIHTAPADVPAILREFARVLTPGRSLLLGYFEGDAGAPFDHAVTTAHYWSARALAALLAPHGFLVERASARQDPGVRRQGDLVATLSTGTT